MSEQPQRRIQLKEKDLREYAIFIASVIAIGAGAVWSLVNYASVTYTSKELYEANNHAVKEKLQDVKDQLQAMAKEQREMNEKILRYFENRGK